VADRLHSAAIHLLRRLRREDAASAISAAQLSALSVVVFSGPLSLGELAAAEQVRPATMSRLVDALERRRLAVREVSPADRRVVLVRATEAGKHMLAEGRSRRICVLAEQLGRLAAEDLEVVERATRILEEIAQPGG